jgi:CRP/FNR family transcriptional regulator, cyclic AMP receptor protein
MMETATRMNGSHSLWWMDKMRLLNGLSDADAKKIGDRSLVKVKAKGAIVFAPGEPSDAIYFVQSGRVKVGSYSADGRETIKAIMHAGDMFGEKALFGEVYRSDFAIALDSDVTLYSLPVKEALSMMQGSPDMAFRIMANMAAHMANVERRLESLVFKDARTRIIDLIREMAQESGLQLAGGSVLVNHSLTHQDIASLTSTSRQTVTTVLNDLKDLEIINFDRRTILVHDMARL